MDETNNQNPSQPNPNQTANTGSSVVPNNESDVSTPTPNLSPNPYQVVTAPIATPIPQVQPLTTTPAQVTALPGQPSPTVASQAPTIPTLETPNTTPAFEPNPTNSGLFPKGTQLFLHPDHEAIKAAALNQNVKAKVNFKMISLVVFVIFLVGLVASIWFIFLPKSVAVHFAKVTHDSIDETTQKLETVNKSLTTLYSLISNSSDSNASLSSVLGISNGLSTYVFESSFEASFEKISDKLSSNSSVKAFSTSQSDPNKALRDIKDSATEIEKKSADALESQKAYSEIIKSGVPELAKELSARLTKLENHTFDYIDQSSKTGKYYAFLEDSALEIQSISTATNFDVAISQLSTLKTKFADYKNLPDEMDKVNKDSIELLDVLITMLKEVKGATSTKTYQALIEKYYLQVQAIGERTQIDEINFWKNNKTLGSYNDISKEQTELLRDTKKLKNDNSFFLLDWTGIS